ncbi:ECF transporter S component [Caldibacillus thermoamylovorans]
MNAKKISLFGIFLALAVVGASIKIPAVIASVALDMVPALIGTVVLGGRAGGCIAFFGHLLSALIGGMPLGPFHVLIAVEMAVLVWVFGYFYQKGKRVLGGVLFVVGNTFLASLPFLFIIGTGFYVGMIPSLCIGSLLNTILAILLTPSLSTYFAKRLHV